MGRGGGGGLGIRYPTRATVITSDFISAQDNGLIRRRRLRFRLETVVIELNCFLSLPAPDREPSLSLFLSLSFRFRMEFPELAMREDNADRPAR